ncbi:MAG: type III pantothenate kinase [Phycisphaerales bacterium]|nr:MAG: type III pantothenate kinase [Phycisphaerales bacterium]
MSRRMPGYDPDAPVIVIEIGNTTTAIGTWHKDQLKTPLSVSTDDEAGFDQALEAHVDAMPKRRVAAVIIGSVVPQALQRIQGCLENRFDLNTLVVGDTIPLPIDVGVADATAIGVDRVCAAAAAYDKLQTGCIIVDFGSAVTVDLVDDEGTLVGGAILPGLKMQLRALHECTAALPEVKPGLPETPYGRNTTEAMQAGVCRGVVGAVRALVEAYANSLNRWPQVLGTGGDLTLVGPICDFLDTQVQYLVLRGVGVAYMKHLKAMGV